MPPAQNLQNKIYSLLFEVPKGSLPSHLGAVNFVEGERSIVKLLANNHAKHAASGEERCDQYLADPSATPGCPAPRPCLSQYRSAWCLSPGG